MYKSFRRLRSIYKYRETACPQCCNRLGGYILNPTAKECNDLNCDSGVKKSDRDKDCTMCNGTGKRLVRCDYQGCVNGQLSVRVQRCFPQIREALGRVKDLAWMAGRRQCTVGNCLDARLLFWPPLSQQLHKVSLRCIIDSRHSFNSKYTALQGETISSHSRFRK
jgi:hypothetical protein